MQVFKSFDSSKLDGDTLRDQALMSFNSGANQCVINNSIYRIDNVTETYHNPDDYDVRGSNNVDGYHLYETQISTAAVHSGVLANGESGSVYVKCFDVKLASFTGTTSNGVTSVDDNDTSATDGYSFKFILI